jgi:class 3 adenylate cyclase
MIKTVKENGGAGATGRGGLRRAFAQLRVKLTLPYIFLAVVVAFAAAFTVTQLLARELENRFKEVLLEAGKAVANTVVYIEQDQLAIWRPIAYTEGFAEAAAEGDRDTVGLLASPLVVNEYLDCLDVLDREGNALLAMHHQPGGKPTDYIFTPGINYHEWEMVQKVLAGEVDQISGKISDKYADVIETEWGWVFYTIGPIKFKGQVVGVLLVGTYLDNLVQQLYSAAAQTHVSVYANTRRPAATTLPSEELGKLVLSEDIYQEVLAGQEEQWVIRRDVEVAGEKYAQVFGVFEVRHGHDLGVFSVAKKLSFVTDQRQPVREFLLILFGVFTAVILLAGAVLASRVVKRVQQLATATQQVAQGDLTTQVESRGYDEIATLASDFNRMVIQLQEGRTYRDLLGLTSSPAVAERLRQSLEEGRLRLEAQLVTATVLFCDIRGFTRLSENKAPEYVINLLNEYMQGVVKIIQDCDGVVNKFVGDAALAFFGILPETRPSGESARRGVVAALAMLDYLDEFNRQRSERGEDPLRIGVGVNTGPVVAGTMGSDERLEYTVLGDTVNVSQRLSDLNKEYPEYDVFFGASTYHGLDGELRERTVHIGETRVKGRVAPVDVYGLAKE